MAISNDTLNRIIAALTLGAAGNEVVNQLNNPVVGTITMTGFFKGSATDAITAFAGGGQGSAVLLTTNLNRVTVVATAADSVKLPPAAAGHEITVINAAANSLNVFPNTGDVINALSANAAFAVAATKVVTFYSTVAGIWHTQLTA